MPGLPVTVYPTPVQGEGAGERIAATIALAGERRECEVLIVCRGGGSIEDLWSFNEEVVARAIRACPVPVVSGIGHETDFTIADFVADRRAPTPTGAAEMASPAREELSKMLMQLGDRLLRVAVRGLQDRVQRLDYLSRRLIHPGERIRHQLNELRHLSTRLSGAWERALEDLGWQTREIGLRLIACKPDVRGRTREAAELARRLREGARRQLEATTALVTRLHAHLKHLNPQSVLERGYSITEGADGAIVRDGSRLALEEEVKITFARGWVGAQVRRRG